MTEPRGTPHHQKKNEHYGERAVILDTYYSSNWGMIFIVFTEKICGLLL